MATPSAGQLLTLAASEAAELSVMIALVLVPLVACLASVLIAYGLSGTRRGERPHCAHCHYDVGGLPAGTQRCPECHRSIIGPQDVLIGEPVTRRRWVVWGAVTMAAMLLAVILATVVIRRWM
ncbi:MAG: hypothetical protein ACK51N_01955 [bacterium]|jgi:hypothetical protein|nr:hypothetical protein [Phycisphaerales bacterium]MCE2653552.1 hypothetical protein [Planctomycetaceae bacterium]